jgi:hypothetical protein
VLAAVPLLLRADPERRIQTCAELLERLDPSSLAAEQADHAPTPVPVAPARPSPAAARGPVWPFLAAGVAIGAILAAVAWAAFGR